MAGDDDRIERGFGVLPDVQQPSAEDQGGEDCDEHRGDNDGAGDQAMSQGFRDGAVGP